MLRISVLMCSVTVYCAGVFVSVRMLRIILLLCYVLLGADVLCASVLLCCVLLCYMLVRWWVALAITNGGGCATPHMWCDVVYDDGT